SGFAGETVPGFEIDEGAHDVRPFPVCEVLRGGDGTGKEPCLPERPSTGSGRTEASDRDSGWDQGSLLRFDGTRAHACEASRKEGFTHAAIPHDDRAEREDCDWHRGAAGGRRSARSWEAPARDG